ncbi:hypothetical protein [Spirosoma foliorum]|uniref:TonB C-terminal domain-containing protein n=1 Tax=Spirosoma foliorum TaxID=2710596 RepID=A0A7G5H1P2_9BACT|nr:hypothetical protein [Spirosoma foliorum]QMW05034.1 hypothetical protein H3H32_09145 [Spirosoma foliorum]
MIRLVLLLCTLSVLKTYGQIVVYKDDKGQILTKSDSYASGRQTATTATYTQVTFLESPFYTFPVWQEGKVQLDKSGKELDCELAYNLVTSEVLCKFAGDSAVKVITPELFTINNTKFVRLQNSIAGLDYRTYFSIVHNGPTKLWTSLTSQLEPRNSAEEVKTRYYKDLNIQGIYRVKTKYYIQKGDREPKLINLSKKLLLEAFADQAQALESKIPNRQLTTNDVIDIINVYDSLVVANQKSLAHLSKEELFKRSLESQITYPGWVGKQGIYGRVYAGFDVDAQGGIQNVVILSPENIGFGFTAEVKKALENLTNVSPDFKGRYAVPIAFIYTNKKEKSGPHIPINRLPEDRVGDRQMLDEIAVPYVVTMPVIASREVWGYYK